MVKTERVIITKNLKANWHWCPGDNIDLKILFSSTDKRITISDDINKRRDDGRLFPSLYILSSISLFQKKSTDSEELDKMTVIKRTLVNDLETIDFCKSSFSPIMSIDSIKP